MFRVIQLLLLCFLFVFTPLAVAANVPVILVVGDSISAAYGMQPQQGWVNLLQQRLRKSGFPHQVVNASISGDTTANGAYRFKSALEKHRPEWVILELGGNDGLRGLSLQQMRANLSQMIDMAQQRKAQVLLVGIRIPPNYGKRYTDAFYKIYPELSRQHDTPLVPFLLKDIGGNNELMQDDGIHPNVRAQPMILDNVWHVLQPRLKSG